MKKIITSNGQFNVTNALYESIKKNNPELLESMNLSSANVLAIAKKYEEITGEEYTPENEGKVLGMFIKCGSNLNEFGNYLKQEKEKEKKESEQQQNNNQNVQNNNFNNSNLGNTEVDSVKLSPSGEEAVNAKADLIRQFDDRYLTTDTINVIIKIINRRINEEKKKLENTNNDKEKCKSTILSLETIRDRINDKCQLGTD